MDYTEEVNDDDERREDNEEGEQEQSKKRIRFLYKLADGASLKSFGLNVASMAGIPDNVIDLAHNMIETLEKKEI